MLGRLLVWSLVAGLAIAGTVLWTAAAMRPYADNQRNWLILLAAACITIAGLVVVGALLANRGGFKSRVRAGAHRLAGEWHRSDEAMP
jgi:hypothetical protein